MKITKLEHFSADGGWDTYTFLKISTDAGLVGWSEFNETRGRGGFSVFVHALGESIIGKDPLKLNELDTLLQSVAKTQTGGMQHHAYAAIMNGVLDIKGKAQGVPVHELFGGAYRERIPIYWSRCAVARTRFARFFDGKPIDKPAVRSLDDVKRVVGEARALGIKAVKANLLMFDGKGGAVAYTPGSARGSGWPELNLTPQILAAFTDQLAAMREAAGSNIDLIFDVNTNYRAEGFRKLARAAEPYHLMWLEMDLYDPAALAAIRHATSTPIGSLEQVLGRRSIRPYLEQAAVDVAIIDAQYNGLPEALRMAAMCDAFELNVASHGFAGPLSTVMSAQFCAAVPNLRIMEVDLDEVPWRRSFLTNPYRIEHGELVLPTGPGWGTDIDEAALEAHPAK